MPRLSYGDVGIAMGKGTDVALESAKILLNDDLGNIIRAVNLSRITLGNIRQNLLLPFYNALGIPLAAGALHPAFGISFSPIIAASAMALSSVSVIANALRLNWASPRKSHPIKKPPWNRGFLCRFVKVSSLLRELP